MLTLVAAHLLLAAGFFVIVNWIGRHAMGRGYVSLGLPPQRDEAPALNLAIRIGAPWVLLIISSAVLYGVGLDGYTQDFYMVAGYYVLGRWGFNIARGRHRLMNWSGELVIGLTIISGAWWIYDGAIRTRASVFPSLDTMVGELWVLVAGFTFYVLNQVRFSDSGKRRREVNYILATASRFRRRYGEEIREATDNEELQALIIAIMIHEDFNRPRAVRMLEYLVFPFKKPMTLGLMQVRTDDWIGDRESVRRGIAKIVEAWELESVRDIAPLHGDDGVATFVALSYNPSSEYAREILRIRAILQMEIRPDNKDVLLRYEPLLGNEDELDQPPEC